MFVQEVEGAACPALLPKGHHARRQLSNIASKNKRSPIEPRDQGFRHRDGADFIKECRHCFVPYPVYENITSATSSIRVARFWKAWLWATFHPFRFWRVSLRFMILVSFSTSLASLHNAGLTMPGLRFPWRKTLCIQSTIDSGCSQFS